VKFFRDVINLLKESNNSPVILLFYLNYPELIYSLRDNGSICLLQKSKQNIDLLHKLNKFKHTQNETEWMIQNLKPFVD